VSGWAFEWEMATVKVTAKVMAKAWRYSLVLVYRAAL
jgi:hypothetical protein